MRLTMIALFAATALTVLGCEGKPEMRPDPVEVKVSVRLPGGASAKDLNLTLVPQQNSLPGGGKLDASGALAAKVVPGKYIPYFDEGNAKFPAYAKIPESFKSPTADNAITIDGTQPVAIEVK
ncbi:unnamed protein product [Gemmataceae bacterium]|nr:unnamed protein product [Gemmataceae bacterium]VTU01208.1 unnamed protein product [Gemmataceae bacterium]